MNFVIIIPGRCTRADVDLVPSDTQILLLINGCNPSGVTPKCQWF